MRRISFIASILGLLILFLILSFLPPKSISSPDEISPLQENQKLTVTGKVLKETYSKNYKILSLDNKFQLKCPISCPTMLNKNISALTQLESYNDKNYLKILKIFYLD